MIRCKIASNRTYTNLHSLSPAHLSPSAQERTDSMPVQWDSETWSLQAPQIFKRHSSRQCKDGPWMKLQDGAAFRDLTVFSLAGAVLTVSFMDHPQIKKCFRKLAADRHLCLRLNLSPCISYLWIIAGHINPKKCSCIKWNCLKKITYIPESIKDEQFPLHAVVGTSASFWAGDCLGKWGNRAP